MARPQLELADIVRRHRDDYVASRQGRIPRHEARALHAIASCRTAELGAHVSACSSCEHSAIAYNSCRNRHCPKCLGSARGVWLAAREDELLPVPYFHVVFTLPRPLARIALQNRSVAYEMLMRIAAETLQTVAADPKHLGARIGCLIVLHTWSQELRHHPHAHCVVPGGGLSPDRSRWVACRKGFFLPVRVLSRLFRGRYLAAIESAHRNGQLAFHGQLAKLHDPAAFLAFLAPLREVDWVVYAKAPFHGPQHVLRYLARYTHRVAISNRRLVGLDAGRVAFKRRSRRNPRKTETSVLDAVQFIRRFLLHLLPRGFQRIRHYGLLANRCRRRDLARCRRLITKAVSRTDVAPRHDTRPVCPACQQGLMRCIRVLPRDQLAALRLRIAYEDTS